MRKGKIIVKANISEPRTTVISTAPTNTSIFVEWNVEDDCDFVETFKLSWKSEIDELYEIPTADYSYNITNLVGCTEYELIVTPVGDNVDYVNGSKSEDVTTLTEGI